MFLEKVSLKVHTFELVLPSLYYLMSLILDPQSALRHEEYSSNITLYIYVKKQIIVVIGLAINNSYYLARLLHHGIRQYTLF